MNKRGLNIMFITVAIAAFSMTYVNKADLQNSWNKGFDNAFGVNKEDITDMYSDYIDVWKVDIKKSFDKAESEVYQSPSPDILGPDPDPKKCICRGSGIIVHGDGHKTVCPYHGKKMSKLMKENNLIYTPLLTLE